VGPKVGMDVCGKSRCTGFRSRTVQPVSSCYNTCFRYISARIQNVLIFIIKFQTEVSSN
jgi:hypothetical protein